MALAYALIENIQRELNNMTNEDLININDGVAQTLFGESTHNSVVNKHKSKRKKNRNKRNRNRKK